MARDVTTGSTRPHRRGFGAVRKLPSGKYQASYAGPDTARHKAPNTFDTREDAEAWLTDERRLISSGTWLSPDERAAQAARAKASRSNRAFDVYTRNWLARLHDIAPTTRSSYTTSLERHLVPWFGETPIDEIGPDDVEAWYDSYGNRTPTARAHAYQVLRKLMLYAEDRQVIARNPARIKRGGSAPRETQREPEVLTLDELLELVEHMPEHLRALTLLSGMCGLRFGEAAALRRADINLAAGTVRVANNVRRVNGKKLIGPPKTPEGRRVVAMPTIVVEAMREHMERGIAGGRLGYVFAGRDGEPLAATALYGNPERVEIRAGKRYLKAGYGFYAAREAIGRPTLHWHDLRRTAATLGAQAGATVKEMQLRLGHATPSMALHYQGATAERDRAIADRLQASIDARVGPSKVLPLNRVVPGST